MRGAAPMCQIRYFASLVFVISAVLASDTTIDVQLRISTPITPSAHTELQARMHSVMQYFVGCAATHTRTHATEYNGQRMAWASLDISCPEGDRDKMATAIADINRAGWDVLNMATFAGVTSYKLRANYAEAAPGDGAPPGDGFSRSP